MVVLACRSSSYTIIIVSSAEISGAFFAACVDPFEVFISVTATSAL